MSRWIKGGILGLAAASLVLTGIGWQEPALAAGPQYDPTFIHGIDLHSAQQVRDCEPSLLVRRVCMHWHLWGPM